MSSLTQVKASSMSPEAKDVRDPVPARIESDERVSLSIARTLASMYSMPPLSSPSLRTLLCVELKELNGDAEGLLSDLPGDTFVEMAKSLSPRDIVALKRTSKSFHSPMNLETIWKVVFENFSPKIPLQGQSFQGTLNHFLGNVHRGTFASSEFLSELPGFLPETDEIVYFDKSKYKVIWININSDKILCFNLESQPFIGMIDKKTKKMQTERVFPTRFLVKRIYDCERKPPYIDTIEQIQGLSYTFLNGSLFVQYFDGHVMEYNFMADHRQILSEIAKVLEQDFSHRADGDFEYFSESVSAKSIDDAENKIIKKQQKEAMDRFFRMPKEIQDAISLPFVRIAAYLSPKIVAKAIRKYLEKA